MSEGPASSDLSEAPSRDARARLAGAAAHELNNILNGIGMVIHEARDPQRTPSELRDALSDISTFLERGGAIVAQLRELAGSGGDGAARSRADGEA